MAQWAEGRDARACPRCRATIERSAGCNHMTCHCGHEFCWLCGEPYTPGHFSAGRCVQFGGAAVDSGGAAALSGGGSVERLARRRRRLWYPLRVAGVLWLGGPLRGPILDAGQRLASASCVRRCSHHMAQAGLLQVLALALACPAAYWAFPPGRPAHHGRTVSWLGGQAQRGTAPGYLRLLPALAGVLLGGGSIAGVGLHGWGLGLRAAAPCAGLACTLWLWRRHRPVPPRGDTEEGSWRVRCAVDGVSRLALVLLPHTVMVWFLDLGACTAGRLLRWLHLMLGWSWVPLPLCLCRALLLAARGMACAALCVLGGIAFIVNLTVEMQSGAASFGQHWLRDHFNGRTANYTLEIRGVVSGGLNTYWRQNVLGLLRFLLMQATVMALYHEASQTRGDAEHMARAAAAPGWLGVWLGARHPSWLVPLASPELLASPLLGMLVSCVAGAVSITSLRDRRGHDSQLHPTAAICLRIVQLLPLFAALVVCSVHEMAVRDELSVHLPPLLLGPEGSIIWTAEMATSNSPAGWTEWLWGWLEASSWTDVEASMLQQWLEALADGSPCDTSGVTFSERVGVLVGALDSAAVGSGSEAGGSRPHTACWDSSSLQASEVHWQLRLGGYNSLPQLVAAAPPTATLGQLGIPYRTAAALAQQLWEQRQKALGSLALAGGVSANNASAASIHTRAAASSYGPRSWSVSWLQALLLQALLLIVGLLLVGSAALGPTTLCSFYGVVGQAVVAVRWLSILCAVHFDWDLPMSRLFLT
jgi:hypothetical protein